MQVLITTAVFAAGNSSAIYLPYGVPDDFHVLEVHAGADALTDRSIELRGLRIVLHVHRAVDRVLRIEPVGIEEELTNQDVVRGHAAVASAIAPCDFLLLRQVARSAGRDAGNRRILPPGINRLVSTTPTNSQVVGGLDQSIYTWWQNTSITGISTSTAGNLTQQMEIAWRDCTRYGGMAPNYILVGELFLDAYRLDAKNTINRTVYMKDDAEPTKLDASVGEGIRTGMYFKNVEIIWDPVMTVLDGLYAPTIPWEKRCYFLNTKFLKLRPIQGHWMINRTPPRVYDRYVHYFALTAKAALTTGKRNAHAVLSIQ